MNHDCRSCSTCLNNENGICIVTGKDVRVTDNYRCSYWDDAEDDRPPAKAKIKKSKKKVTWD